MRAIRGLTGFAALAALVLGAARTSVADVRPHSLIGDGAVFQQGRPVPIWGTADDGEKVVVRCQDQEATG